MERQNINHNGKKINELINKLNNLHKRFDVLEEKVNKIGIIIRYLSYFYNW